MLNKAVCLSCVKNTVDACRSKHGNKPEYDAKEANMYRRVEQGKCAMSLVKFPCGGFRLTAMDEGDEFTEPQPWCRFFDEQFLYESKIG